MAGLCTKDLAIYFNGAIGINKLNFTQRKIAQRGEKSEDVGHKKQIQKSKVMKLFKVKLSRSDSNGKNL